MRHFMVGLARVMAILGGIVLSLLIILTCLSILGRSLNGVFHSDLMQSLLPGLSNWILGLGVGPVNGDFELVESGVAFAIFAFLPICQITGGHASVDLFTNALPRQVNRVLRAVIEVVFAAVLILITWRLYDGMLSKLGYGETTFLLQMPVWWAYAASLVGAVSAAVVGLYVAGVRVVEALMQREFGIAGGEIGE